MEKHKFKFGSLPYNDTNANRIRVVLRKLNESYSLVMDESGCCIAVIELEHSSYHLLEAMSDCFEAEGLPRPER
jgi:hypothetical protein